jgi:hypothetical protein
VGLFHLWSACVCYVYSVCACSTSGFVARVNVDTVQASSLPLHNELVASHHGKWEREPVSKSGWCDYTQCVRLGTCAEPRRSSTYRASERASPSHVRTSGLTTPHATTSQVRQPHNTGGITAHRHKLVLRNREAPEQRALTIEVKRRILCVPSDRVVSELDRSGRPDHLRCDKRSASSIQGPGLTVQHRTLTP